jgi:hypothetical protein
LVKDGDSRLSSAGLSVLVAPESHRYAAVRKEDERVGEKFQKN